MITRAVLLAGGRGTRLLPATKVTNKHLLPIYNEPMIFYPLKTLLKMGITNILIVCGDEHTGGFARLLGSGKEFGVHFSFCVQEGSGGIADALSLAEDFSHEQNIAVILGDNIFSEDFSQAGQDFSSGAMLFTKSVPDPERFGVVEHHQGNVLSLEEKPQSPKSDTVATGLYFFDNTVFDKIRRLTPSVRNELEIIDVHQQYLEQKSLQTTPIKGNWTDAGTYESFFEANRLAREIHQRSS